LAFAPLAFLPFRSRFMWLVAAPLAEVLLSRMSTTYTLGTHYAGAWIGWVLVAFAFAVRKMAAERALRWLYVAVALCVVEYAVANPLHPKLNLRGIETRDRVLDAMLATIPDDMSVATQEEAYTHLAFDHPRATLLPENPNAGVDTCYILVDRDFPDSPRLVEYAAGLQRLIGSRAYVLVKKNGGIELYRSSKPCSAGASAPVQPGSARSAE
jgi:hypothetical protein